MKEIKTARLLLQPFRESDRDDLYAFLKQLEHDEFEGYPGINRETVGEHLRERLGSEEYYAVALADTGKVIGNLYCGQRDCSAREVGCIINECYRGQGYAAEALRAVIEQAFRDGAHRVYAECDPRNTASRRLLEAVGMRREAHLRQTVFFHRDADGAPIWMDTYVYAITENDRAAAETERVLPTHIVAAAGFVRNENGEILLVRSHRDGWVLPGGIVEVGENVIDGVKREILEETGVIAEVGELVCVSSNTCKHPGYNGVKEVPTKLMLDFICRAIEGTPRPSEENTESAYFSEEEAEKLIQSPAILERFKAYLEYSGRPVYLEYVTRPEYGLKLKRLL
jgi:RimJ/RimL family protein N-acetyltransferase